VKVLITAVLVVLVGTASASAASLPVVPTFLGAPHHGRGMQVRPSGITYTGDGTAALGAGALNGRESRPRTGLRWSSWTQRQATGTGNNWIDFCNPSCDIGADHAYPVRVRLWDAGFEFGWVVFARMTITYTG
jgi:hypothetical protein